MLYHKENPLNLVTSSLPSFSLNTDKLKDILTWKKDHVLKEQRNHNVVFGETKRSAHRNNILRPPKDNIAKENDYSRYSNTDEYSKTATTTTTKIAMNIASQNGPCCPHCHKRIDSLIEKLIKDIRSLAPNQPIDYKLEDFQFPDKIKTYHFPAKKSFLSSTVNQSRVLDSGRKSSNTSMTMISNAREINMQSEMREHGQAEMSLSQALYELAEHKVRVAEIMHENDEKSHELQKKKYEVQQLQVQLKEKTSEVEKLAKEHFFAKQENCKYKETIYQLNLSHKMLLRDFNKYSKLHVTLRS